MDGIDAFFFRHRDNAIDIEIRGDGAFALADEVRFIGFETMEAEAVLLGVDSHSAKPEFSARAENADCDFAAVGSEQFPEWTDGVVGRTGFASANYSHAAVYIVV
jgi:hypothetical protein